MRPSFNSLFLFFIVILFISFSAAYSDVVRIESAEIEWHKYYDNIIIKTSDYIKPSVKLSSDRLVLFFKDSKIKDISIFSSRSARISRIFSRQYDEETAQIIIKLRKPIKYEIASLLGRGEIILEIAENSEKIPVYSVEENGISKKRGELYGRIIVIDPGHGGGDPGAFGLLNTSEKDLTLRTSVALAKLLKSMGADVFLTRKNDTKIDLQGVVQFAESVGADIFIGVHFNSIAKNEISGTETHYFTDKSQKLAVAVQKNMVSCLQREDRGTKKSMLYTVHHTEMPAIIIEPLYITNIEEARLAKSNSFQSKIAESVALGIKEYFKK